MNSRGRRMAARLQFEANLLGEVALVLDDQNWSGGQSVSRPSRRPVPLLLCQRVDVLHIARRHLASFLRRPPFLLLKCNMTGLRKSYSVVVSSVPRGVRTFCVSRTRYYLVMLAYSPVPDVLAVNLQQT
jgi:hypothetical protein